MKPVHSEMLDGVLIEIFPDNTASNPREQWDQLGVMFCKQWGDKGAESPLDENGKQRKEVFVMLPLYAYIHSGVRLSTAPFSCPFDSGQIGFIYVTRERTLSGFKTLRGVRRKVLKILNGEVKEYEAYLNGEVYGWEVTDGQGNKDSCWGYIGNYGAPDGALEEARAAAAAMLEREKRDAKECAEMMAW